MAEFGGTFNAREVDPNKSTFPIYPPADYPVMIVKSEMKPTKDGTGQYLELEMEILDGQHKGSHIFDKLNLVNNGPKKAQTEAIAQKALSQICHAVGVLECTNSEQLHMKPMIATVVVVPPKGQYDEQNQVKKYAGINGAAPAANAFVRPGAAAQAAAQPAQAAPAAAQAAPPAQAAPAAAAPAGPFNRPSGATPPWGKKAAA